MSDQSPESALYREIVIRLMEISRDLTRDIDEFVVQIRHRNHDVVLGILNDAESHLQMMRYWSIAAYEEHLKR